MSSIKNIIISRATYNDITDKSASGILSYLAAQNLYNPSTQVPIVYLESTKKVLCNGTLYGEVNLDDINSLKGAANGIAGLNGNGKVPASQLPSYIDDTINGYYNEGEFYEDDTYQTLITPTTGKIYYDLATGKQYRWNEVYIEIIDMQPMSASNVTYSNTNSALSANNMQDAVDELNRKIYDAGNYETVLLTIGSADSTFNPVGQTITVTFEDGSATQYEVLESRQITFTIQRGMRYTISGTSTDDYRVLPISVKAAIPTRYLTMRYIPIATGVFIIQKDGNYYLREEYDAETMAEDAVGVLVLTSALINAGFGIVIAKTNYTATKVSNSNWNNNTTALAGRNPTVASLAYANHSYADSLSLVVNDKTLLGYIACYAEWAIVVRNQTEIINCQKTINTGWTMNYRQPYATATVGGENNIKIRTSDNGIYYGKGNNIANLPFFYYPLS